MKLHLGCGDRILPGWVNVDVRALPGVDMVAPVESLPVEDGGAEIVYACHVLEHVRRPDTMRALKEWWRVLKPGGALRLAVPSFEALLALYHETHQLDLILGPLYGRQDYPENTHYRAFDEHSLRALLRAADFRDVQRWDWRHVEHGWMDDGSQHYWPHMDKERGRLLSLNLEATK